MPKVSDYSKAIPRLYKRGHLEVTLFTWVTACQSYFPTISVVDALKGWYRKFEINEKDYPISTASKTYFRMQKELLYLEKDEKDNKLAEE